MGHIYPTVTYPHCFLTAFTWLLRLPVLAGTSDSKNPDLYYWERERERERESKSEVLTRKDENENAAKNGQKKVSDGWWIWKRK